MRVEDMAISARAKLVRVGDNAPLIDAARLLASGSDIVVVVDGAAVLRGVVTNSDIVRQMSVCEGAACRCPVSAVMTRAVALCRAGDLLHDVSERMKALRIRNIVLVDDESRPVGLLTAQAILRTLLGDAEDAEAQLVDYVGGVGYR